MTEKIAVKELQGLEQASGFVILYEIALNDDGSSRAYLTRALDDDLANIQMYDYETNNQLNTYTAIPMQAEGFDHSSTGTAARPVITFANVLTTFGDALGSLTPDDLIGKKIYRRRTLAKYLKDGSADTGSGNAPVELPRQIYIIDRIEQESAIEISFELTTPYDVEGLVLPYRVVGNNACSWVYQGASPVKVAANTDNGGCSWHETNAYIINNVLHYVYVNVDDEYVIPVAASNAASSTVSSITKDTYYKTTITLGLSTGVRRYKEDGDVDTSADGGTINSFWQAVTTSSNPGTPSYSNSNFLSTRSFSNYSSGTSYYTYTDYRANDYVKHSDGTHDRLWRATRTQVSSSVAPGYNSFWERADTCGKRLTSCAKRFGFNPINSSSASTGKTTTNANALLPFGGFPGARKFK